MNTYTSGRIFKLRSGQQGLTAMSIVGLLAIFAFFVLIGLAVAPVYIENFKVKSHLEKLAEDKSVPTMTNNEIRSTLFRRFDIDDITHVKSEDVTITRDAEATVVDVAYEVYAPFLANIEIVISFNEKVSVPN